jgi:hypothetical protein
MRLTIERSKPAIKNLPRNQQTTLGRIRPIVKKIRYSLGVDKIIFFLTDISPSL